MALRIGQVLSGAGVIADSQRQTEEAERIARQNQMALEALNRQEAARRDVRTSADFNVADAPLMNFNAADWRTDVAQIAPPPAVPTSEPAPPPPPPRAGVQERTPAPLPLNTAGAQAGLRQIPTLRLTQPQWDSLPPAEKQRRLTEINAVQKVRVPGAERFDMVKPKQQTAENVRDSLKAGDSGPTTRGGARRKPSSPTQLTPEQAKVRGFRNFNPGNLRPSGDQWQGMVGVDTKGSEAGYLVFDSPESGIRALAKNLMSYQRNGIDTVEGIISRWAPQNENNTEAYIKFVSNRLGVPRNATLDVQDTNTMQALVRAIITKENGADPYSNETLLAGINAAYSGRPATPGAAAGPETTMAAQPTSATTPAAGVTPQASTAQPTPQPPRQFFGARPEAVNQQIRQTLTQRQELVKMANLYRRSGMASEFLQLRQQIMTLDSNMVYLQGMQGLSEFAFGNDPARLSATWSQVTDNNIRIQPRTDGNFNVLLNGKEFQTGLTQDQITQMARSSFDTAYVQQMQEYSAKTNQALLESDIRIREEAASGRIKQRTDEALEQAKMIREIFVEQAKGNIQLAVEMYKNSGYNVKGPAPDGTYMIVPPGGKAPFYFDPAGRTVKMPDGQSVTVTGAQRVAGLPNIPMPQFTPGEVPNE